MLTRKLIVVGLLAASVLPGVAFAQEASKMAPAEPAKAPEPPKPPYSLTANVYIVSDYFFRGITQTWDKPAIQGGFDFIHDSGLYVGTWLSNVSGNQFPGGSLEWDFYGGYNHKVNDDITVGAGLYYYYYPGANFDKAAVPVPGVSQTFDTFEGNISASWKFVSFKFSYAFSSYFGATNTTGFTDSTNGTYYPEVNVAYPLAAVEGLSLIGHLGYTHYSAKLSAPNVNGETDPSYMDWKLGVSYVWKDGWTVGAYYVGTNNTDFYKNTTSFANSDVKDLGGSGGYITVGRTF